MAAPVLIGATYLAALNLAMLRLNRSGAQQQLETKGKEAAARWLDQTSPDRGDRLVRQLHRARLADGQYDHCELTFRELGLSEESVVKSVCAIYHGGISYPSTKPSETAQTLSAKPVSA